MPELSTEKVLDIKIIQAVYQISEREYHWVRNYAVGCGCDDVARLLRLCWELKEKQT